MFRIRFVTPRTVFNRTLSPRRSFASTSLPLAELKAVKNAARVTLNDVVLATVAGALDRFFEERGEHAVQAAHRECADGGCDGGQCTA